MIEQLLSLNTNTAIVAFAINNMVLLLIIKKCIEYVCKKTPWAGDDDLASFFGGLIDLAKKGKGDAPKIS